ncbi:hypothetical protein GIB67_011629 [Kingdonia uniflora]|uniref:DUSP domain-containing protein n=1 Tax=Kingdonia uniflora TaxID=39325 RepID=A0A7J7NMN1_9MAGN|nr:hypothetical protein GIB67_011629 [Kingdonia uniflora]
MYFSLPLPSTVTPEITVTVFYGDGTALPMPFSVTVLKDGSCKDLLETLSVECYLRSDKTLLLAEVHVPIDDDSTDFQHSDKVKLMKTPRPRLIDNSHLIVNGSVGEGHDLELMQTLMEGCDYVLAPQKVWKKLHYLYKGGPALPRRMIQQSSQIRSFSVEVYPLRLQLTDARDNKQFVIHISKKVLYPRLFISFQNI